MVFIIISFMGENAIMILFSGTRPKHKSVFSHNEWYYSSNDFLIMNRTVHCFSCCCFTENFPLLLVSALDVSPLLKAHRSTLCKGIIAAWPSTSAGSIIFLPISLLRLTLHMLKYHVKKHAHKIVSLKLPLAEQRTPAGEGNGGVETQVTNKEAFKD